MKRPRRLIIIIILVIVVILATFINYFFFVMNNSPEQTLRTWVAEWENRDYNGTLAETVYAFYPMNRYFEILQEIILSDDTHISLSSFNLEIKSQMTAEETSRVEGRITSLESNLFEIFISDYCLISFNILKDGVAYSPIWSCLKIFSKWYLDPYYDIYSHSDHKLWPWATN